MPWNAVLMPNLQAAMNESDSFGLVSFRTCYGPFHPATDLHMYFGERGPYEARPLLAGAHADLFPHGPHIGPTAFTNNNGHDFLISFGFRAVR